MYSLFVRKTEDASSFLWRIKRKNHRKNFLPAYYEKINANNQIYRQEFWYYGNKYEDKSTFFLRKNHNSFAPLIVYKNGTKEWWQNLVSLSNHGHLHRKGKPAVEYANGDYEWWVYGKRHRENGPAVVYGDKQYWFINGEFTKLT
jgi:hypothetical protein